MSAPIESHVDTHTCFGCHKTIESMAPHLHLPLDEWGVKQGLPEIGIGDTIQFPFCEPCTEPDPSGWQLHAHDLLGRTER